MAISKRLRYEILRRDNHTCRYCGATASDTKLTIDHVAPVALGGSDDPSNLVAACRDCNAGKSSSNPDAPLVETVTEDALRWAAAIKEVAARRRESRKELNLWFRKVWFSSADGLLAAYDKNDRLITATGPSRMYTNIEEYPSVWTISAPPRPRNWLPQVENFIASGLERDDIADLVMSAMRSSASRDNKWRYFCGACWRSIADLQEQAKRLINSGGV